MRKRNITLPILLLILAVIVSACAPQTRTTFKPELTGQGELYFYLQPLPQEMSPLSFTLSDISIIGEDGSTVPLLDEAVHIQGRELINIQKQLLKKTVDPGRYKGIVLGISDATISTEEGDIALLPPAKPIRLDLAFSVLRGRAHALFLVLSPEYLVSDGFKFTPRFVAAKPHQHPKNLLGFISNSDENLVTVFNKRTMEIVQVIHTGVAPRGMAIDQANGIVYVALAGDDAIAMISVDTMELYGTINLRFGDEPAEIALSGDGRTLVSANYGSGTVSIIDTRSRLESNRLSLEPDPVWVVAGRDGAKAYVLHSMTNKVSVVDLVNRRLEATISLNESPLRGALNRDGSSLYITAQYSTDLQLINTGSRGLVGSIFIGGRASSITVDPKNDLVYIGKRSGEVVVVDPSSGMFIDSFPIQGDAGYMTIDGEENMLLVLSARRNLVQKLNMVSKREVDSLLTETGAHAMVVMGEL